MLFEETKLKGAYLIHPEPVKDERGFFARSFCGREFGERGLEMFFVQCNISYNKRTGTLRGMHFQAAPHEEAKIVSCTSGAVYDVIVDMRPESRTYCEWIASYLSAENHAVLYVPRGFAHGFQTLRDDTVVFYQMSEFYHPASSSGVRWDDPVFDIEWPQTDNRIISETDNSYDLFVRNIRIRREKACSHKS